MWRYIKANDLQDPKKKTDILPDETLHVRRVSVRLLTLCLVVVCSCLLVRLLAARPALYPHQVRPRSTRLFRSCSTCADLSTSSRSSFTMAKHIR